MPDEGAHEKVHPSGTPLYTIAISGSIRLTATSEKRTAMIYPSDKRGSCSVKSSIKALHWKKDFCGEILLPVKLN